MLCTFQRPDPKIKYGTMPPKPTMEYKTVEVDEKTWCVYLTEDRKDWVSFESLEQFMKLYGDWEPLEGTKEIKPD